VEHELSTQRPAAAGNLDLQLEPPPRAASPDVRLPKQGGDVLYLGFLAGMSPDELALRMPGSWDRWISKLRPPTQSLRQRLEAWLDKQRFIDGLRVLGWRRTAILSLAGAIAAFTLLFLLLMQTAPVRPAAQGDGLFTREAPAHLQMRHQQSVNAAAFSPDGKQVVTASTDGTAQFWDAQSGVQLGEIRLGSPVERAEYNSDGSLLLTIDEGFVASIWQTANPVADARHVFTSPSPSSARFSPDGKRVVLADFDGGVHVWNSATEDVKPELRHGAAVNDAVFSSDGRQLATSSTDGTARLWDSTTGAELARFVHEEPVMHMALSADREHLATATLNTTRIWQLYKGSALTLPVECTVKLIAFSPNGRILATACTDEPARLWNAATGMPIDRRMAHVAEDEAGTANGYADIHQLAFSADGSRLVTAGTDGTARVWAVETGEQLGPPLRHDAGVVSARFSPDGRRIVTASRDSTARVWSAIAAEPSMQPLRHQGDVAWAFYSPDGSKIFTGGRDPDALLWNAKTGAPLGESPSIPGGVRYAVFSADGRRLMTLSNQQVAQVWDTEGGLTRPVFVGSNIKRVAFSPDSDVVATADDDVNGVVQLWDAATGARKNVRIETGSVINGLEFDPDGKRLLTAGSRNRAILWDADTGRMLLNNMGHDDEVNSARFSADGRFIVTASDDDTAHIWKESDGSPVAKPLQSKNVVTGARFSPSGDTVLTVSGDDVVTVWDTTSGDEKASLVHEQDVNCARYSPDGTWIATASADGTARIWSVATGELVAAPIAHAASANCVEFSPDGRHIVVPVDREITGGLPANMLNSAVAGGGMGVGGAMDATPAQAAVATRGPDREAAAYVYAVPPDDAVLIQRAASLLDRWSVDDRALFALGAIVAIFFVAQFRAVRRWRRRGRLFADSGDVPA
jgi:WD40 repeat protein